MAETTQTNTTQLPPFIQEALANLVEGAGKLANQQYSPYQGPRVAPNSDVTNQGLSYLYNTGGLATPYYNMAMQAGQGGLEDAFTKVKPYLDFNNVSTKSFPQHNIEEYMNPYRKIVGDEIRRQGETERAQIAAQRGATRSFGGSRGAVAEGMQRDREGRQIALAESAAFDKASNLIQGDQALDLKEQIANLEMKARMGDIAARTILDNLKQKSGLAQIFAGMGSDLERSGLSRAQQMLMEGSKLRNVNQDAINASMAEWDRNQLGGFDREMANFYSSILRGYPYSSADRTTTNKTPDPSLISQILGAGIGGLGIYSSLKGTGAGNFIDDLFKSTPSSTPSMGIGGALENFGDPDYSSYNWELG